MASAQPARAYLLPRIDGSRLNFSRSNASGPPDVRIDSGNLNTFRANASSNSFLTGSVSSSCRGKSRCSFIESNNFTASASKFGSRAVTSRMGKVCNMFLPIRPLPDCCLLACHQCNNKPSDVFAHTTSAFS